MSASAAAVAAAAAAAPPMPLDVMVDIETLGTDESAPVLSIGACLFDPNGTGEVGAKFHVDLVVGDNTPGETISINTVFWWFRQSDAARLPVASARRMPVQMCFAKFMEFASQGLANPWPIRIWANSPSFDLVIMRACMKRHAPGMKWQFSPFNERDVRTLLSVTKTSVDRSSGVAHNALADAVMQAEAVQRAMKCVTATAVVKQAPYQANPQTQGD